MSDSSCCKSVVEAAEGRAGPVGGRVAASEATHGRQRGAGVFVVGLHDGDRRVDPFGRLWVRQGPSGLECHDEREQHRVLAVHVIEQVALQGEEGLLQRQQHVRHVVAVTTHDLGDHGLESRQFLSQVLVVAALDVRHEGRQRGVCPGWAVALGRRGSLEFGHEGGGIDVAFGAHAGEW